MLSLCRIRIRHIMLNEPFKVKLLQLEKELVFQILQVQLGPELELIRLVLLIMVPVLQLTPLCLPVITELIGPVHLQLLHKIILLL